MTKTKRATELTVVCFSLLCFAVSDGTIAPCFVFAAEHDLWMVDSRSASWNRADEANFEKIRFLKRDGRRWVRSDAETFFSTQDPTQPLVMFSPGYTSTTEDVVEAGMTLIGRYDQYRSQGRTVLWHWPSEKVAVRLVPDIRSKISVARANAGYMAMFLRRLKPESRVALVAFSFGNRIICDAVEKLGDDRPEGMLINLVLMAAATDQGALSERGKNANVPRLSHRMLVLYNPEDFRLQFYPMLYGGNYRPEALGRYGPPLRSIPRPYRDRIESVNVNRLTGACHRTLTYLNISAFRNRIGSYLFFDSEDELDNELHYEPQPVVADD